ncbi:hypothetical protein D1871_08625 [Nakamurella silvestris]|nr:hypothetical protein D1871_08625 [Nakamurella silvestris]
MLKPIVSPAVSPDRRTPHGVRPTSVAVDTQIPSTGPGPALPPDELDDRTGIVDESLPATGPMIQRGQWMAIEDRWRRRGAPRCSHQRWVFEHDGGTPTGDRVCLGCGITRGTTARQPPPRGTDACPA